MTPDSPALTYYLACQGRWRAPLTITVYDPGALAASGMSWLDRVSLHLLARWPRVFGRVVLDTSVSFAADGEVVHTTAVRWLGLPLRRSVEFYRIEADGARIVIRGGMTGDGEVDPTATHAQYRLRWLGVVVSQRATRAGDRVTVEQEGPGFRGVQGLERLERRAP